MYRICAKKQYPTLLPSPSFPLPFLPFLSLTLPLFSDSLGFLVEGEPPNQCIEFVQKELDVKTDFSKSGDLQVVNRASGKGIELGQISDDTQMAVALLVYMYRRGGKGRRGKEIELGQISDVYIGEGGGKAG